MAVCQLWLCFGENGFSPIRDDQMICRMRQTLGAQEINSLRPCLSISAKALTLIYLSRCFTQVSPRHPRKDSHSQPTKQNSIPESLQMERYRQ